MREKEVVSCYEELAYLSLVLKRWLDVLPSNHSKINKTLVEIAEIFYNLGDDNRVISYLQELKLESANHIIPLFIKAKSSFDAAQASYQSGRYIIAFECYKHCLHSDLWMFIDKHPIYLNSLKGMSDTLYNMDEYNKALAYQKEYLAEIDREIFDKDHCELATSYAKIGRLLTKLGQYKKAVIYYEKALSIHPAGYSNYQAIASILDGISDTFYQMGEYAKALEYQKECLAKYRLIHYKVNNYATAASLTKIGHLYIKIKEYSTALEYLKNGLKMYRKVNAKPLEIAYSLYHIGDILFSFKSYGEALNHLEESMKILNFYYIGAKDLIIKISDILSSIHLHLGDYKEALEQCLYILLIGDYSIGKITSIDKKIKLLNALIIQTQGIDTLIEFYQDLIKQGVFIKSAEHNLARCYTVNAIQQQENSANNKKLINSNYYLKARGLFEAAVDKGLDSAIDFLLALEYSMFNIVFDLRFNQISAPTQEKLNNLLWHIAKSKDYPYIIFTKEEMNVTLKPLRECFRHAGHIEVRLNALAYYLLIMLNKFTMLDSKLPQEDNLKNLILILEQFSQDIVEDKDDISNKLYQAAQNQVEKVKNKFSIPANTTWVTRESMRRNGGDTGNLAKDDEFIAL
jgi:tetratricopeptide (TPR) repeat protein